MIELSDDETWSILEALVVRLSSLANRIHCLLIEDSVDIEISQGTLSMTEKREECYQEQRVLEKTIMSSRRIPEK